MVRSLCSEIIAQWVVPPPRLNLVRYHGVLAPNAGDRDRIVPGAQEAPTEGYSHAEQCPSSVATLLRRVDARTRAIFRAKFPLPGNERTPFIIPNSAGLQREGCAILKTFHGRTK